MEEGRYLGVAGGRRDCGVLLGVCLGGISGVCLSFTGCTAIFHKLWKITKRSHNKLLHNWFSYCGVSMQIADKCYPDAKRQMAEGVFCPDRSVKYGIMWI